MPRQGLGQERGGARGAVTTPMRAVVTALAVSVVLGACTGSTTESVSLPSEAPLSGAATGSAPSTSAPTGSGAGQSGSASAAPTPTKSSSSTASPTAAASTGGTPAASATTVTGPVLTLETNGLSIATGAQPATHYGFGSSDAAVRAALATVLGGTLRVTPSPECGQGPRTTADRNGFSILVDGARFVGWVDQGAPKRHLTTRRGLGIGSTLTQVRLLLSGVSVSTDTLGPEFFTTSGLGGLLTGTTGSSRITNIYAGETCFFR